MNGWTVPKFTGPALCAEVDSELFFPEKGGSTKDAKKLCGLCDVRQECLNFAVDNDERFGVWGGLSERERRRLVLQRRPAVEPAVAVEPPPVVVVPPPARPVAVKTPARAAPEPPRRQARPWTTSEARDAVHTLTGLGYSPAEIARELGLSPRTVRTAGAA